MSEPTPTCPEHGDAHMASDGGIYETDQRIWWKPWRKRWAEWTDFYFCMAPSCEWMSQGGKR